MFITTRIKRILIFTLIICCLLLLPCDLGRFLLVSARQDKQAEDTVARTTTRLLQIDVVVTDKDGKQVTDLQPDDFEVFEDNQRQQITNFSYILLQREEGVSPVVAATPHDKNSPPIAAINLRPEQVQRTIALVVDDLGLSIQGMFKTREALRKFIDEQMQPRDLVAIVRTGSSGSGALEQFTTNKEQLRTAIDKLRWNPLGRSSLDILKPITNQGDSSGLRRFNENFDENVDSFFSIGTLGGLNFILHGMEILPGRKSVILISDGFRLRNKTGDNYVLNAVRNVTNLANQASIVIYSVDAKGLLTGGLTAADSVGGENIPLPKSPSQTTNSTDTGVLGSAGGVGFGTTSGGRSIQDVELGSRIDNALNRRQDLFDDSQTALKFLATQTGGVYMNSLDTGINNVLEDQKGYYLLGYIPEMNKGDKQDSLLHNVTVKVKRRGLQIRSRTGFYGINYENSRQPLGSAEEQLVAAVKSPFEASSLKLRFTSLFTYDTKEGSFLRCLIHIDTKSLSFNNVSDGGHRASFEILTVAYGENGQVAGQLGRKHNITIPDRGYQQARQEGFVYTLDMPIKDAGFYQLRTAVRDATSGNIGAAGQLVEVPDVAKGILTLSNIFLTIHPPQEPSANVAEQNLTPVATQQLLAAAQRSFHAATTLEYMCNIYNATVDSKTQKPQLTTQLLLYRDDKQIFAGNAQPLNTDNQPDLKKIGIGGTLKLNQNIAAGAYTLQIIVTDQLAKKNQQIVTKFVDFEIVK
ncbi:MAG: VWA domain-containing protein [Acidobacteriota bacterium]